MPNLLSFQLQIKPHAQLDHTPQTLPFSGTILSCAWLIYLAIFWILFIMSPCMSGLLSRFHPFLLGASCMFDVLYCKQVDLMYICSCKFADASLSRTAHSGREVGLDSDVAQNDRCNDGHNNRWGYGHGRNARRDGKGDTKSLYPISIDVLEPWAANGCTQAAPSEYKRERIIITLLPSMTNRRGCWCFAAGLFASIGGGTPCLLAFLTLDLVCMAESNVLPTDSAKNDVELIQKYE